MKLTKIITLFLLVVAMVFSIASCGEDTAAACTTHTDADGNEKCDVCAAHVPHIHSFGTEWKTDSQNHWHVCACGEKSGFDAHIDPLFLQQQCRRQ